MFFWTIRNTGEIRVVLDGASPSVLLTQVTLPTTVLPLSPQEAVVSAEHLGEPALCRVKPQFNNCLVVGSKRAALGLAMKTSSRLWLADEIRPQNLERAASPIGCFRQPNFAESSLTQHARQDQTRKAITSTHDKLAVARTYQATNSSNYIVPRSNSGLLPFEVG